MSDCITSPRSLANGTNYFLCFFFKVLLDHGAYIEATDWVSRTALDNAALSGHVPVVKVGPML